MTLFDLLKLHEGFGARPYKDTLGKWTFAHGRCLDTNPLTPEERAYLGLADGADVRSLVVTREQADWLLRRDVARVSDALYRALPWMIELRPARQAALLDMAYQMGVEGLLAFKKALAALKLRDYKAAAAEVLNSTYAVQTPTRAIRIARMIKTGEWK